MIEARPCMESFCESAAGVACASRRAHQVTTMIFQQRQGRIGFLVRSIHFGVPPQLHVLRRTVPNTRPALRALSAPQKVLNVARE